MTPNFVRCAVCNVHLSQWCLAGCCRRPPGCRPSESVTIYCQCREVKLWCGYILTSAARQTGLDRANRSQSERWEVLVVRNRNQIVHQKCYIQINVLRTSYFPSLFFTVELLDLRLITLLPVSHISPDTEISENFPDVTTSLERPPHHSQRGHINNTPVPLQLSECLKCKFWR